MTFLPRRPNHDLTAVSFQVSKPLRFLFRHLFRRKLRLGAILGGLRVVLSDLGASLGGLGASWGGLGTSWGGLGRLLEPPGAILGDPKSIQKSIRNLMRKQAESRRKKMAQTLRLSMFQSWTKRAANQIRADSKSIETAFEVISSHLLTRPSSP